MPKPKIPNETWHVGQNVVLSSPNRRQPPRALVIKSIGRRWANMGYDASSTSLAGRFDINTGLTDNKGIGSPSRVYPSMSAYQFHQYNAALHKAVMEAMCRQRPCAASLELLANELGLDVRAIQQAHGQGA